MRAARLGAVRQLGGEDGCNLDHASGEGNGVPGGQSTRASDVDADHLDHAAINVPRQLGEARVASPKDEARCKRGKTASRPDETNNAPSAYARRTSGFGCESKTAAEIKRGNLGHSVDGEEATQMRDMNASRNNEPKDAPSACARRQVHDRCARR